MGPFSSEPDLHVRWLVVKWLLAAGQLKKDLGSGPNEIATIGIHSTPVLATPSVELRSPLALGRSSSILFESAQVLPKSWNGADAPSISKGLDGWKLNRSTMSR